MHDPNLESRSNDEPKFWCYFAFFLVLIVASETAPFSPFGNLSLSIFFWGGGGGGAYPFLRKLT